MTAPPAWPLDTNMVSEVMRLRPEPWVAGFLDSIADGWSLVHCAFGTGAGNTCVPVRYAIACLGKRSRSVDAVQSSPPV